MLKIVIQGHTGAGKSSVAKLIAETLEAHGIKTEIHDNEHPSGSLTQRLATLANRHDDVNPVVIETVQLNRS